MTRPTRPVPTMLASGDDDEALPPPPIGTDGRSDGGGECSGGRRRGVALDPGAPAAGSPRTRSRPSSVGVGDERDVQSLRRADVDVRHAHRAPPPETRRPRDDCWSPRSRASDRRASGPASGTTTARTRSADGAGSGLGRGPRRLRNGSVRDRRLVGRQRLGRRPAAARSSRRPAASRRAPARAAASGPDVGARGRLGRRLGRRRRGRRRRRRRVPGFTGGSVFVGGSVFTGGSSDTDRRLGGRRGRRGLDGGRVDGPAGDLRRIRGAVTGGSARRRAASARARRRRGLDRSGRLDGDRRLGRGRGHSSGRWRWRWRGGGATARASGAAPPLPPPVSTAAGGASVTDAPAVAEAAEGQILGRGGRDARRRAAPVSMRPRSQRAADGQARRTKVRPTNPGRPCGSSTDRPGPHRGCVGQHDTRLRRVLPLWVRRPGSPVARANRRAYRTGGPRPIAQQRLDVVRAAGSGPASSW